MHSKAWWLFQQLDVTHRRDPFLMHPVYQRDQLHRAAHPVITPRLNTRLALGVALLIVLTVYLLALYTGQLGVCCLSVPLVGIIVVLPAWALPLSLTISPVIVRERQRGTWDLLRITPLDEELLLLAKGRHALQALKPLLEFLNFALLLTAMGIGLWNMQMILTAWDELSAWSYEDDYPWLLLAIVLAMLVARLFLVDRAAQLLSMGLAAVAAGSLQRSVRGATVSGGAAALGVWLVEAVCGTAVLVLSRGLTHGDFATGVLLTIILGPVPGYIVAQPVELAALLTLLTLIIRELAIRALWRGALRAIRW